MHLKANMDYLTLIFLEISIYQKFLTCMPILEQQGRLRCLSANFPASSVCRYVLGVLVFHIPNIIFTSVKEHLMKVVLLS